MKAKAQSQIGWVHFSRDALRRVEARLREEQEGVRDEIGFLLLHQAYADRFFPGTSVLQTRLRYIFFVPWIYQELMESFHGGELERVLTQKEIELTGRLKHEPEGVIGIRSYPNPVSQPASFIYWTALGKWGFLRKLPDGDYPSRSRLNRYLSIQKKNTRLLDDDGAPLDERWRPFVNIPDPPDVWDKKKARLNFKLRREEKEFLIKHLVALKSGSGNGDAALLARLVERRVTVADLSKPWEKKILAIASNADRKALILAGRIAALSAIGRGVYASLVESALERDGVETDRKHRDALQELVDEYREDALKVDIAAILNDCPGLEGKKIINILRDTTAWLEAGTKKPALLHACYESAELARKGFVRSKLPSTPHSRERRREWSLNKGDISEPLHYRWKNVRRLLMDLQGE